MKGRSAKIVPYVLLGVLLVVGLAGYAWHRYHTPEAYTARGFALQAAHKFREEIPQFEKVVRLQPNSASAHDDLGNAWMSINYRPEKMWEMVHGKREVVTAVKAYRPDAAALSNAVQEFKMAVQLKPNDVGCRDLLAIALYYQGRHDAAIQQYQQALQIVPSTVDEWQRPQFSGELHLGLAFAYLSKKQYGDVIREYRQCLFYEPERLDVGNSLADLLNKLGKRDEARAEWKQVVSNSAKYQDGFDSKQAQIMLTKYPEQHLPARTGTI